MEIGTQTSGAGTKSNNQTETKKENSQFTLFKAYDCTGEKPRPVEPVRPN